MVTQEANPTSLSRNRFGFLLFHYRTQLELSQRALGGFLGVTHATIARLEDGTRKPSRRREFYSRLRNVPGLSYEDIEILLSADDLSLGRPVDYQPERAARIATTSVNGVRVSLRITCEVGCNVPDSTLDRFRAMLKLGFEADLRYFFDRLQLVENSQ